MDQRIAIMGGLMVKAPFERGLLAEFEAATGIATAADWAPTTIFAGQIAGGRRADVLVVTAEAMNGFVADGIVDPATRADFAEMTLGLGVRAGAPVPDISTLDAFRRTLFGAQSIAISRAGASGISFRKLIAELGWERELTPRLVTIESGLTGELVADGRAQMAIQQLSELDGIEGVEVVGGFPPEVAIVATVAGGVFAEAAAPEAARSFMRFLRSDAAAAILKANRLAPLAAGNGG